MRELRLKALRPPVGGAEDAACRPGIVLGALVALVGTLVGCTPSPTGADAPASDAACTDGPTLFGRPEAATGLTDAECGPACTCAGERWEAPTYDAADVAALLVWELTEPWAPVTADPYATSDPPEEQADAVCGFVAEDDTHYHLTTFEDPAAAARITHMGACGVCSTLTDLAVYMSVNDLTAPVRDCGLTHMGGASEEHVACLEALGFTTPCAWIWYWNTLNTQSACLTECLAALGAPYNEPDGSLNACLQCDEEQSGPVFKAVAGRTRRNTGLPNAICRACGEVDPIEHRYP